MRTYFTAIITRWWLSILIVVLLLSISLMTLPIGQAISSYYYTWLPFINN